MTLALDKILSITFEEFLLNKHGRNSIQTDYDLKGVHMELFCSISNKDTIKKAFAESLPNNVELVVGYDVKPLSGHVYIVGTAIMSKIKKSDKYVNGCIEE